MLTPSKHAHPDRTVIYVAVLLLKCLRKQRLCNYDTLRNSIRKAVIGGDVLLLPSLNFLYLLGLIEYHPKTDSIEYVGQNEAV